MRFSLLTFNAVIACFFVLVSMFYEHRFLGLALSAPPVALIGAAYYLQRRNHFVYALVIVALYVSCWVTTHYFGGIAAVSTADRWFQRYPELQSTSLSFDPVSEGKYDDDLPISWHFIGTPSTPCPFVIQHYVATADRGMGVAETRYYLWLPGRLHCFYTGLEVQLG